VIYTRQTIFGNACLLAADSIKTKYEQNMPSSLKTLYSVLPMPSKKSQIEGKIQCFDPATLQTHPLNCPLTPHKWPVP
jgi:hypothetical protein